MVSCSRSVPHNAFRKLIFIVYLPSFIKFFVRYEPIDTSEGPARPIDPPRLSDTLHLELTLYADRRSVHCRHLDIHAIHSINCL